MDRSAVAAPQASRAPHTGSRPGFPWPWLLLLIPLAVIAGMGAPYLVAAAQTYCEQGINASANFFGVIIVGPALTVVALLVVWGCAYIPIRRPSFQLLPVLLCVVLLLTLCLLAIAQLQTPSDYLGTDNPACAGNQPPWWPWFLPG